LAAAVAPDKMSLS